MAAPFTPVFPLYALTLHQFWAFLMAPLGLKLIETRCWRTHHRGVLAIHSAQTVPASARAKFAANRFAQQYLKDYGVLTARDLDKLPLGVILGVCEVVACVSTDEPREPAQPTLLGGPRYVMPDEGTPEYAFGDYRPGRFMVFTERMRVLERPVPCKGGRRLWKVPEPQAREVYAQLERLAA
jgi:hypothetical protein